MPSQSKWSKFYVLCLFLTLFQRTESAPSSNNLASPQAQRIDIWPNNDESWPGEEEKLIYEPVDSYHDEIFVPEVNDDLDSRHSEKRLHPYAISIYRSLLRHLSSPGYKMPTKFSRFVRARLNRMPIYYGKRSANSQKVNPFTSFREHPESIPPAEITNTENDMSKPVFKGEKSSFSQPDRGQNVNVEKRISLSRRRVNRMPLTFGKRLKQSLFGRPVMFPIRETRSRINRMPLTFGKREGSGSISEESAGFSPEPNDLTRIARGRVGRMPAYFGKRNGEEIPENSYDIDDVIDQVQRSPMYPISEKDVEVQNGGDKHGNSFEDQSENKSEADDNLKIETRSRMHRMPLTFGKRSRIYRMPLTFGKRLRVNRMPLTFGKRLRTLRMPLTYGKRSRTSRMPLTFGKRSRLNRMPLAFGKRYRLHRMPLTFGKRSRSNMDLETFLKADDSKWEDKQTAHLVDDNRESTEEPFDLILEGTQPRENGQA